MSLSCRGIQPRVRPETEEETLARERDERIYFRGYAPGRIEYTPPLRFRRDFFETVILSLIVATLGFIAGKMV